MAVQLVAAIQRWQGLAADTKPTSAPVGSRFLELDTAKEYIWDGSSWNSIAIAGGNPVDTELPAARLAADNLALPTAPDVLATLMGYDGSTLDLLRTVSGQTGILEVGGQDGRLRLTTPSSDAIDPAAHNYLRTLSTPYLFNGSTFDRHRNNLEGTLLASAARTATTASSDQTNYNARGVIIRLVVTANPGGAETLTLDTQVKDPISETYFQLSTSGAQAFGGSTGSWQVIIYPGAGASAAGVSESRSFPLPRDWRVNVTHSASGSWTYSVSYQYIL